MAAPVSRDVDFHGWPCRPSRVDAGDTAHGLLHGVHGLPAFEFILYLERHRRFCLHADVAVMVYRPKQQVVATALAAEGKGMAVERGPHRAKLEPVDSSPREVFVHKVKQQRGQQRPMNHQCRVQLFIDSVFPVVVNTMGVVRECGVAKQQYGVGCHFPGEFGLFCWAFPEW